MIRPMLACACAAALAALSACSQQSPQRDEGERGAGPPPIDAAKELAALGPPAGLDVQAMYQGPFEAVGSDEPYWQLDLLDEWASFKRPGLTEVGGLPSQKDYRAQGARIVAGPLVITLRAGECVHNPNESDPSKAEKYPYKAQVEFDGVSYDGCARRGGAKDNASDTWTASLSELLPAIDACLAKIEDTPAEVTIAYTLDNGQTSVRLRDSEGGRYECSATLDGAQIDYWGALADRDVMQGEGDPVFLRGAAKPAKSNCTTVEPAKSADGKTIGWLQRTSC